MSDFEAVAREDEIEPGTGRQVYVHGRAVAVFNVVPTALPGGTPATYACFTSGGALISSASAC